MLMWNGSLEPSPTFKCLAVPSSLSSSPNQKPEDCKAIPGWQIWGKETVKLSDNKPLSGPKGLPWWLIGKESTCNAGDPSSIPGSGRSTGEGIGCALQYSWAFLVKNPPAMRETWARSLGWEDPVLKGKATHSSILTWRIPGTVYSMGSQRVRHDWATFTSLQYQKRKSAMVTPYFHGLLEKLLGCVLFFAS